jgi:hypothetical protein
MEREKLWKMEAQVNSQSALFSLMPVRHQLARHFSPRWSSSSRVLSSPQAMSIFSWENRPLTHLPASLGRARLQKPSVEIITLFSHPSPLEFADCDNPLMPSALKFSSHSQPPAKSLPNSSSTCGGILLSLQESSPEAWWTHENETKWQLGEGETRRSFGCCVWMKVFANSIRIRNYQTFSIDFFPDDYLVFRTWWRFSFLFVHMKIRIRWS